MKKIVYILLFSLSFAGCKKQLDQLPISDLSNAQFWQTAEHARLGNASIYDGVQKTLSGNYTDWGDARSDNFTYGGTGENQINIALNGLNATTGAANWNNLYMTIGRANVAIKYLPTIKDLSELNKNHYLAQAYALRAYMYWYAVRGWGAVPVRLVPYENVADDPNVSRSSADSVINNVIIPDLQKALTLLDKNAALSVWEINNGSILSILTDVYLWKKDYAKVISSTDQLIALNRYALAPTIATDPFKNYRLIFSDPSNSGI
ncbi:MAG TPA: RagB/SusD family nutrient uptake outer membrane protein, partial [Chitinophagaceae bacterium]|nr:RagB/SusD family nutrient uptake outer membrane protein [Chitinophagaceae bacterium]